MDLFQVAAGTVNARTSTAAKKRKLILTNAQEHSPSGPPWVSDSRLPKNNSKCSE